MRQIKQRLGRALEPFDADLIQQQRQDNGHREAEDQIQHVQQQRIDNGFGEITVLKTFSKIFKPTTCCPRNLCRSYNSGTLQTSPCRRST